MSEQLYEKHALRTIADFKAENARLQRHLGESWHLWKQGQYRKGIVERERDGYKAQAERRGEALEFWLARAGHDGCLTGRICRNLKCAEARAALAATPEKALEIHKSQMSSDAPKDLTPGSG